jgi:group I intron endonuclease
MTSFVYLIQNHLNGSIYIGKTDKPANRWYGHRTNGCNEHLRRAIQKYGVEHFTFDIIEMYPTSSEAFDGESSLIIYLRSIGANLYNQNNGGKGGKCPTREVIDKIKAAYKRDADTDTLRKRAEGIRRTKSNPERRKHYRQEALRINSDPIVRQRHSDNAKRLWSDTNFREKQRLARVRREQRKSDPVSK